MPREKAFGTLLVVAACAGTSARPARTPTLTPTQIEAPVTDIIEAAFAADCLLAEADSLWAPDAVVVADGRLRFAAPRFAGVGPGGAVAITTSRLEVRQSLAWVYLEYRWSELKAGLVREGRATVLLAPAPEGTAWRIVHAHSSSESR